jgi:ribonuclease Y
LQVDQIIAVQREELAESRAKLNARESKLNELEQKLAADREELAEQANQLRLSRERFDKDRDQLVAQNEELNSRRGQMTSELERLSGLTADEAREELLAQVEQSSRQQATIRAREIEQQITKDAEKTARNVIVTTIQRMAVDTVNEAVVSTVELPSDEMKGRVIGREGRNIRTFEQITGVNVVVDDTPGLVLLSCFDPVRRETARVALSDLIADGRINPVRIEETYQRAVKTVADSCQKAAEDALLTLGITGVDPGLYPIIGSLKYRTSYGQNVLAHMIECGRIAAMVAAELGLDVEAAKRAAFLHDLGKAVVTSGDGSHALEGAELARKHGESPVVVNAIAAHHNEVQGEYVEAIITQIADSISGSRPGARRESLEAYVQRLERLEEIASAHRGVERVFAMQAGREVRVMVFPEEVDDAGTWKLAQEIASEVEDELTYPGNIKVSVVRESVATQTAH